MRLSQFEIENILKINRSVFGSEVKIYLFGSRIDDNAKGGDIDLFIEYDGADKFAKKMDFLSKLQEVIGEQKIDVIFSSMTGRFIELEAKKGVELNLTKIKVKRYLNECDRHLQRIEEAYDDINPLLPLSVEKYINLTKDEVQAIDQYLFRFAKLQDTLGDKLFRLILKEYEPTDEILPFIDMLNKLEKLGFINSAREWMNLRKIRNEISHQYDDEPEEMSQAINNILNHKEIIKEIYLKVKKKSEGLIGG
ncbi:MAG: nucleotidyltransferase domain-containing protein [Desulfuromusa sp.]|nr:nucleotidyltransferase domain-containing protein [Desulfuromusa sp.]